MIELKIPSPGESITEVVLSKWFVEDGSYVKKDQEVAEIESDKATLPLIAPESGSIVILVKVGETIKVGTIACKINEGRRTAEEGQKSKDGRPVTAEDGQETKDKGQRTKDEGQQTAEGREKTENEGRKSGSENGYELTNAIKITPVARKMMEENKLSVEDVISGLKRIGKEEIEAVLKSGSSSRISGSGSGSSSGSSREVKREPMSQLRKKLSKRLVTVKNETAMLTTFNEADMSALMELRHKHQIVFTEKYGIKLGIMSFFVKAATIALQNFPKVNSMLDGDDIITPSFIDIGIAVQTEKGLMVPVLRNTQKMSLADIEKNIALLAEKARSARISMEEMTGGTFTITNGGVFGSLLSTPIINPPQASILGMHNIVERPVAINGKVEIRQMMYLALSYDHRLIDGKDSVSFLVKIKELIETPCKMIDACEDAEKRLLEI